MAKTTSYIPTQVLTNHMIRGIVDYSENIDFIPITGIHIWIARIRGISGAEDCFKGAELLIKFDAINAFGMEKEPYPYNPPSFSLLTPNGKFSLGGKICVSIGEYHRESYKQDLGIPGFAAFLIQAFVSPENMGGGVRVIEDSHNKIISHSAKSKEYNYTYHQDIAIKIDLHTTILLSSGLWIPDPENPARLNKVCPVGKEKEYKLFGKKLTAYYTAGFSTPKDIDDFKKIIIDINGPDSLTEAIIARITDIINAINKFIPKQIVKKNKNDDDDD